MRNKLYKISTAILVLAIAFTFSGCPGGGGTINDFFNYVVTVNGGNGGGSYPQGSVVNISATVPSGQQFHSWTVNFGGVALNNPNSASTSFTMPANNVTVTANFTSGNVTPTPTSSSSGGNVTPTPTPSSSSSGGNGTPTTNTLNGVWVLSSGIQVTASGSIGVISTFGTPNALWTDAINKGYVKVGDQIWRNLTSTGNLTWSGQELGVTPNTSSSNVATGTGWVNATFTLSADGQTLIIVDVNGVSLTYTRIAGGGASSSSGGNGTVTYQGQDYKTVVIGSQTWMAENLNYAVADSKCYSNNTANCAKYGRLYNWATAMGLPSSCNSSSCVPQIKAKHQGICPPGWHIPSNADWSVLMKFINPSCSDNSSCAGAGIKLKTTSGWDSKGTDDYGFAALPAGSGRGSSSGTFVDVGHGTAWWSAGESNANSAYHIGLDAQERAFWGGLSKSNFFGSVRCLKD